MSKANVEVRKEAGERRKETGDRRMEYAHSKVISPTPSAPHPPLRWRGI